MGRCKAEIEERPAAGVSWGDVRPCARNAVAGSEYCSAHDPVKIEARRTKQYEKRFGRSQSEEIDVLRSENEALRSDPDYVRAELRDALSKSEAQVSEMCGQVITLKAALAEVKKKHDDQLAVAYQLAAKHKNERDQLAAEVSRLREAVVETLEGMAEDDYYRPGNLVWDRLAALTPPSKGTTRKECSCVCHMGDERRCPPCVADACEKPAPKTRKEEV